MGLVRLCCFGSQKVEDLANYGNFLVIVGPENEVPDPKFGFPDNFS